MTEEMKICTGHKGRKTPLIWTFVFPGAEYWCPYCGYRGGMFGAGDNVPVTEELKERAKHDEELARPYLQAIGWRSCSYMEFEGKTIKPDELPQTEKDRYLKTLAEWRLLSASEAA